MNSIVSERLYNSRDMYNSYVSRTNLRRSTTNQIIFGYRLAELK